MQKLIFSLLGLFLFTTFCGIVSAAPTCPTPPAMIDLESKFSELSTTAVSNIKKCITARGGGKESSITDFTCPSGDYNIGERSYTNEVLAYQIAVATVFAVIDEDALRYSKALQCMRGRDVVKWMETNRIVIHGDGASVA
jgi:hypothetical protein